MWGLTCTDHHDLGTVSIDLPGSVTEAPVRHSIGPPMIENEVSEMPSTPQGKRSGLRLSAWNLLLLVPLLMLITPWFDFDKPRLFGLPFFYWYQFAFVLVGVACVWTVYLATNGKPAAPPEVDRSSVDELDKGARW